MESRCDVLASLASRMRWLLVPALGLCLAVAPPGDEGAHPIWGDWTLDGQAEESCHNGGIVYCPECAESEGDTEPVTPTPDDQEQDGCEGLYEPSEVEAASFGAYLGGGSVNPNREYVHAIEDYTVMHDGTGCSRCGVPVAHGPACARHAPFVLKLTRTFQSRLFQPSTCRAFGARWQHNYDFQLEVHATPEWTQVLVHWPGGPNPASFPWRFIDMGNLGTFVPQYATKSTKATLQRDGSAWLLTTKWGEQYHFVPMGDDLYVSHRPDWIQDKNGFRLTFTYDGVDDDIDRLERVEDGYGRALAFVWGTVTGGTQHVVEQVILPDGRSIRYDYQNPYDYTVTYANGDVSTYARRVDADGESWEFNDALGHPGSRKHRVYVTAGGQVRGVRDVDGRLLFVPRELSALEVRYEYASGESRTWGADDDGFPTWMRNDRTGAVRTATWDAYQRQLLGTTDYDGHATTYAYADLELTGVEKPDGATLAFAYDDRHLLVSTTDELGYVTSYEYDARGNVTRRTDPDGAFEAWTYDALGNVTSHTDRRGSVEQYEFDTFGGLSRTVLPKDPDEPAAPEWIFVNDVNGRRLSATDPDGWTVEWAYDDADRVVLTSFADGTTEQLVYGTNGPDPQDPAGTTGLVVRTRDRNGNWVDHEHDAADRLVGVSDAIGKVLERVYAPQTGLLASEKQGGKWRSWTHDAQGRVQTLIVAANATTSLTTAYEYDEAGRLTRRTDPYGYETLQAYDEMGRLVSVAREVTPGVFLTESFAYDAKGRRVARTDPRGNTWLTAYDVMDRVVAETDPLGHVRTFVHDAGGHVLAATDEESNTRTWTYTARGKVKTETEPGPGNTLTRSYYPSDLLKALENAGTGGRTTYTYTCCGRLASQHVEVDGAGQDILEGFTWDGNGNQTSRTDGEGFVWLGEFDARDREVASTDPLAFVTTYAYFEDGSAFDGRLAPGQGGAVRVTDANGNASTAVTDGAGRRLAAIDAVGNATRWFHDVLLPDGTIETSTVDRNGHVTRRRADGLGRVVETLDALGHATRTSHDPNGNPLSVTDANGNTTLFTWDAADRKLTEEYPDHDPDDDVVAFTWFDNGWLESRTDQRQDVLTYEYDPAGRVTGVTYPDANRDLFTYDAGGRLQAAVSGLYLNEVTRAYDPAGRVIAEAQAGHVVAFGYDRRSLETSVTVPSGLVLQRTHDARGMLAGVSAGVVPLAGFDRDPAGRLVRKELGNGTQTVLEYDALDRISEMSHTRGTEDIQTFQYLYDKEANKLREANLTFPPRSEVFAYDDADRLVSWARKPPLGVAAPGLRGVAQPLGDPPWETQAWDLDPLCNWAETVVDGVTETRAHNSVNEIVQIDGTPLEHEADGKLRDDGTYVYEYDFNDRLRRVRLKADGSLLGEYAYDAMGRVTTRVDHGTGTTRRYHWDGQQVVEERDGADAFVAATVYGDHIDEAVARLVPGNAYFHHANSLFSPAALTDQAGAVVERCEYGPFGERITYDAGWTDPQPESRVGNPVAFTGRWADPGGQLLDFRARHLAPHLGRYLQRDAGGYAGGMNLYAAVFVPSGIDPFGSRANPYAPFETLDGAGPTLGTMRMAMSRAVVRTQVLGEANCNPRTGLVWIVVHQEHCTGDCVEQHELEHKDINEPCCTGYKNCLVRYRYDPNVAAECDAHWSQWWNDPGQVNWDECQAYTTERDCIQAHYANVCCPPLNPPSRACCRRFKARETWVQQHLNAICPGTPHPQGCPFDSLGNILW